jgi:hypothetical protein
MMNKLTKTFLTATLLTSALVLTGCQSAEEMKNNIEGSASQTFSDLGYNIIKKTMNLVDEGRDDVGLPNNSAYLCYDLQNKTTAEKAHGCISDRTGNIKSSVRVSHSNF